MPLLFSYGTLRNPAAQMATFGREVTGRADRVLGFRLGLVKFTDPPVSAVSGRKHRLILIPTGDLTDSVDGAALTVTDAELLLADGCEVSVYRRVSAPLASGDTAWVYVGG